MLIKHKLITNEFTGLARKRIIWKGWTRSVCNSRLWKN